jgi:hypothetical protein
LGADRHIHHRTLAEGWDRRGVFDEDFLKDRCAGPIVRGARRRHEHRLHHRRRTRRTVSGDRSAAVPVMLYAALSRD